ncbi:MAG TPA: hypothetical protein V6D25_17620 [Leptolyngbyaceae cyanobacterium]
MGEEPRHLEAKKLAIVVGSKKAIARSVRTTDDQSRYTRLWQRLLQPVG